ncbi:MAG: type II toxin-antitoxin system HicA family toxin [Planctomycetes bacterium]|nr:type II toxin-antitoxin system HicA family toxin [Planctomycetota bacterium]
MPRQPRVTGKAMISALRRAGFAVVRVRGSHHFLRHADGRATVVPVHGSEILGPGLLAKILRDCDLTRDAFDALV